MSKRMKLLRNENARDARITDGAAVINQSGREADCRLNVQEARYVRSLDRIGVRELMQFNPI